MSNFLSTVIFGIWLNETLEIGQITKMTVHNKEKFLKRSIIRTVYKYYKKIMQV